MKLSPWLDPRLISWIFAHMNFIIPAKRLRETDTLLAFQHPKPTYPFHVIILPKQEFPHLHFHLVSESPTPDP